MIKELKDQGFVTISDVAKEHGMLKSQLLYYSSMGLIVADKVVGKTYLFKKIEIEKTLKIIEEGKKHGLSLKEIRNKIFYYQQPS